MLMSACSPSADAAQRGDHHVIKLCTAIRSDSRMRLTVSSRWLRYAVCCVCHSLRMVDSRSSWVKSLPPAPPPPPPPPPSFPFPRACAAWRYSMVVAKSRSV